MILVMGASGNIGREIVKDLQAKGVAFRGGYRSPGEAETARQAGVETVMVDYGQPDTLDAAMQDIEKAFFVTSPSPQMPELEGHIVDAAKRAGVRHLVKSSVFGAEGEDFLFARSHRLVEKQIEASGLVYTFLRPNGFMQNLLGQAGSIQAQGAFFIAVGDSRVSEIDVRDIARVAVTALTEPGHHGKAYELTGPESLTYTERAAILSEVLGKPVHYVSPPDADWVKGLVASGVSEWLAEGMLHLMHYYRKGKAERVSATVEQVTGQTPVSYRQFVADFAQAFR